MGWGLGDLFNPISAIQDTWSGLASLPGTPEAFGSGVYGGLTGDLSWNPYSQDNSVWDTGAGGTELSQDPNNRRIGRQIGTAVGAAFTGGALGSLGSDASLAADGTTVGGIAADGTAGAAGEGGSSLASSVAGGAARGAAVNAGVTAAQGGNLSDIGRGALYGGIGGGFGTAVSDANPGSYVSSDPQYQKIFNSGLTGAGNNALRGGNAGTGFLTGASTPALNVAGNSIASSLGDTQVPDYSTPQGGGPASSYLDNMQNMSSVAPGWANSPEVNSSLGINTDSSQYNPDFSTSAAATGMPQQQQNPLKKYIASAFGMGDTPTSPGMPGSPQAQQGIGLGGMTNNLLGLYSAYKRQKQLGGLAGNLESMYQPGGAYAQQMQQTLDRRDAAAGRRSQYGSRAVELQALLAHGASQNAPLLQQLYGAQNQNLQGGLMHAGMGLFNNFGGGAAIQGAAQPYLNQLFGSPMAQPNVGPQPE